MGKRKLGVGGASLEIEYFRDEIQGVSHLKGGRENTPDLGGIMGNTPKSHKKEMCVRGSENRFEWLEGSNGRGRQ